ncbi:hypothetical protein ACE1MS_11745 [Lysinibacillus sp. fkY74-1]
MLKIKELADLLAQVNIPVAYSHFVNAENNPMPEPPYMAYIEEDSNNFGADNKVWTKLLNYRIELYSDVKDLALESTLEDLLDESGTYYETTEVYIQSQQLYVKNYFITITK